MSALKDSTPTFNPNTTPLKPSPVNLVVFKALLDRRVKVPGMSDVTWGDLTHEMIQERIAMLRSSINLLETADASLSASSDEQVPSHP